MNSIFNYARQTDEEEPVEAAPIFSEIKAAKKENIIPPVGIAKPELVQSFIENMGNEEQIQKDIVDAEAYERETPIQTGTRKVLAHGARAAEGFFGGINSFMNLLTPELYQNEEGMPYEPGTQPKGLPGAGELREFTKHYTGKYLEPKSEKEKGSQETASDIGSMFSSLGLNFWQKLLLPIGGQVVKQIVKASGGKESTQDISKLGFMTVASIANLGNAHKVAAQALNEAERMLPRGLSFSSRPTEQAFQRIRGANWFSSGRTPSKGPAMDELARIEAQIANGRINGQMAMQLRRDINEARKKVNAFDLSGPPIDKKAANHYLNEVDNALMASMEQYGNQFNPQWLKNYRLANEAFKITQRSRLISDAVGRMASPLQSQTAKTLFHLAGSSALAHFPAAGAAALPFVGGAKLVQVTNRMIRSPVLRNHYLDVIRASQTGNAALIQKTIQKFDKAAKDLEKNQKSS